MFLRLDAQPLLAPAAHDDSCSGRPPSAQLAGQVHAALRQRYRIEVPVACVRGRLWCRVSAQVYNELGEYQQLADAVKALAAEA